MPAYVIVKVAIHDATQYEEYKKLTPASIAAYQGKFIVRGGEAEALEGEWKAKRVVVIEFPSTELAKQWHTSKEYALAKELRQRIATTTMIVVPGIE